MLTALILVLAATNIAILGWLTISSVTESYRKRHRLITYVKTSRGLVDVLTHASSDGGLPQAAQAAVFEALKEQWDLIERDLPKPRREKHAASSD